MAKKDGDIKKELAEKKKLNERQSSPNFGKKKGK